MKYSKNNKAWFDFINYSFSDFIDDIGGYMLNENSKYADYNQLHTLFYKKKFHKGIFESPIYNYKNYQDFLYESLKTHDIEKFIIYLYKKCLSILDYTIYKEGYGIILIRTKEELIQINEICQRFGYYIVNTQQLDKSTDMFECLIECSFGYEDKSEAVYKIGILYHITKLSKVDKIKRMGLVPKHLDKKVTHPDRIYCLTADATKNEIDILGNELYPTSRYVLLKIDLNKVPFNHKLKFYTDPAYIEFGVFTCENIPPQCIEVVSSENL